MRTPVRVLSDFFKRTFCSRLDYALRHSHIELEGQLEDLQHPGAFQDLLDLKARKDWIVFSKKPFSRPETVVEYLGRYTHRVAIFNQRLLAMEGEDVLFRYKDYRREGRWFTERVHATEIHPSLPPPRPAIPLRPHPIFRSARQSRSSAES